MTPQVISADDHIDVQWMPKDAWTARVSSAWKERAPRVIETDKGPFWTCDGQSWGPWGKRSGTYVAGRRWAIERFGDFDENTVPPTDPKLRLADMDRDGIGASVMYGPVGPLNVADPELRKLCYQTYNDWLADFCANDPQRLIGVGLLPADDPAEAINELHRLAAQGSRHVSINAARANPPVYDEAWEVFWAEAAQVGLPIGFHLPGSQRQRTATGGTKPIVMAALGYVDVSLSLMDPLIGLTFGGFFERYPKLKIVLAESGLGWVPYVLDRMDHGFEAFEAAGSYWNEHGGINLKLQPSEYFRRQVWVTFQDDLAGLKLLDVLGDERVMWASDYPHPDSTWPHSQQVIDRQLHDADPELKNKLLRDNARALYGL